MECKQEEKGFGFFVADANCKMEAARDRDGQPDTEGGGEGHGVGGEEGAIQLMTSA